MGDPGAYALVHVKQGISNLPWVEASLASWEAPSSPPPLPRLLPLGAEGSLTLLRPGPPQTEGDEGDDDEDDRTQDDPDNQVGQVAGACHHGPGAHWPFYGFRGWQLRWGQSRGWEPTRMARRLPGCNCEQDTSASIPSHFSHNKQETSTDLIPWVWEMGSNS